MEAEAASHGPRKPQKLQFLQKSLQQGARRERLPHGELTFPQRQLGLSVVISCSLLIHGLPGVGLSSVRRSYVQIEDDTKRLHSVDSCQGIAMLLKREQLK